MQVKLAFMDDRRKKEAFDERERVSREARVNAPLPGHSDEPTAPVRQMPGSGHSLTGEAVTAVGAPPPYESHDMEDSD
jgi:hypothetical protein